MNFIPIIPLLSVGFALVFAPLAFAFPPPPPPPLPPFVVEEEDEDLELDVGAASPGFQKDIAKTTTKLLLLPSLHLPPSQQYAGCSKARDRKTQACHAVTPRLHDRLLVAASVTCKLSRAHLF